MLRGDTDADLRSDNGEEIFAHLLLVCLNRPVLRKVEHNLAIGDHSSLKPKEQSEAMVNDLRELFAVVESFEDETEDKSGRCSGSGLERTVCNRSYYISVAKL